MAKARRALLASLCLALAGATVLLPAGASSAEGAKAESVKAEGSKAEGGKLAKKAEKPSDPKAEGKKDEVKAQKAGADGKTEAKTEAKADPKVAAKKGDDKSSASPEAKDAKPTVKTVGPPAKGAKAEAPEGEDKATKSADKNDDKSADKKGDKKKDSATASGVAAPGKKATKAASDDEPAPPNTPPIKMTALREEMSHPVHHEERSGTRAEREKLEQLAGEINKAREGLRQDTAKLEALLAARDAAVQAAPAPGAAAATADGEPGKKVPTSLDNLAKAIRGMKAEQAAPIISRVDRKLAADVLLRMPGGDAGKVLGVCKPEVAAELAAEIASQTPRSELKR